jgi:hypothetical protein
MEGKCIENGGAGFHTSPDRGRERLGAGKMRGSQKDWNWIKLMNGQVKRRQHPSRALLRAEKWIYDAARTLMTSTYQFKCGATFFGEIVESENSFFVCFIIEFIDFETAGTFLY